MTLTRGFVRNAVTTPLDVRLMDMAQIACNSDGSPRTGVMGNPGAALVTALATMNVSVAAAEFVVSKGKADGVVILTNDGTVNVAITAAPASNSRIDVIWVKHNDNTTGDADSLPVFGVTAGVAAASPTKPAIPTGALELATLRVFAGTTAANGGSNVLTNTYKMTASRGGTVPIRDSADLATYTPNEGVQAYMLDSDVTLTRVGTAWKLAAPIETRTPVDTGAGVANGTTIQVLNFPALPVDTIVDIDYLGQVGNTSVSAGQYVPGMSGSTGGTTAELPLSLYPVPSGEWRSVPRDARLTIPANTAATHTTIASSTQNGQWRGALRTNRRSL